MKKAARKKHRTNPTGIPLENYNHPDKFGEMVGYRVIKLDRKKHRADTALKIREDHLSPALRVHGGVISAFFDFSFGAAAFTTLGPKDLCSTVELKINYLRLLNLGDSLRCRTEVIFRGKRLVVLQGFIYRGKERAPVAMATATFNIVRNPVV